MNVDNRTIFCHDNLEVLRGINSGCIDLIYLDPPFNKKKTFTAPIGSSAEGASFSDIFREEDVKEDWLETIKEDEDDVYSFLMGIRGIEGRASYNFCYLAYMAIRLIECRRILNNKGSLYLHCDPTMSHYLKILLDCIFGEKNFRNEVIWCYRGAGYPKNDFGKRHDIILRYTSTNKYIFNLDEIREEYAEATKKRFKHYIGNIREGKDFGQQSLNSKGKHPDDWLQIQPIAPSAKERTGYPTQKPIALLERIIKASSNEGDMVLDPFCGCATTCVASEKLNRKWIGIDVSVKAYELVKIRVEKEIKSLFAQDIGFYTRPPDRTDQGTDYLPQKYVYIISNPQYEGEYKVGIASNVKSRLNSYQTADPERKYKLEYAHLTPYFREIEAYIHKKYENKHEWVKGNVEEIKKDIEHHSSKPTALP